MGMDNKNEIVKVWIKRSKDDSRTRKQRDHAWAKALEIAATAPGFTVLTDSENGRQELHRVTGRWPAKSTASRYRCHDGGTMLELVRIYRTRTDGKPRARRVY